MLADSLLGWFPLGHHIENDNDYDKSRIISTFWQEQTWTPRCWISNLGFTGDNSYRIIWDDSSSNEGDVSSSMKESMFVEALEEVKRLSHLINDHFQTQFNCSESCWYQNNKSMLNSIFDNTLVRLQKPKRLKILINNRIMEFWEKN